MGALKNSSTSLITSQQVSQSAATRRRVATGKVCRGCPQPLKKGLGALGLISQSGRLCNSQLLTEDPEPWSYELGHTDFGHPDVTDATLINQEDSGRTRGLPCRWMLVAETTVQGNNA
jgi:hypothetical protein